METAANPARLASEASSGPHRRPHRVCLVIDNAQAGGDTSVEPAYRDVANQLRDAGHEVTLLFTAAPPRPLVAPIDDSPVETTAPIDVSPVEPIAPIDDSPGDGILRQWLPPVPYSLGATSPQIVISYRTYVWLREHEREQGPFDVVHLAERGGSGFYAMTARRQGLISGRTAFVVGLFGCAARRREAEHEILRHEAQLECDFLERRSAELADAVWAPDARVLRWAIARGWSLPRQICPDEVEAAGGWARCQEGLARPDEPADDGDLPTISVCLNHFNRPHYLRQALASLAEQELAPHEVIVLDDGSPGEGVQAELDRIVADFEFDRRGWRLIRGRDLYLGASRNAAAREARGEYILFMDDDNVARPHELATFARVARRSGADVLTCLLDTFEGSDRPEPDQPPLWRHLFAGPAFPLCVVRNTFGDSNALVRKNALMELGGYTEDRGVGHEDWEAYSRFALRGYRVEVVPEGLFLYRTMPGSMTQRVSVVRNHLRSLRPHLGQVPEPYRPLIELAMGQLLERWGYFDPPPEPAVLEPPEPPPPPLRYRIVDAVNDRIKFLKPVHRLARRLIAVGWPEDRPGSQAG